MKRYKFAFLTLVVGVSVLLPIGIAVSLSGGVQLEPNVAAAVTPLPCQPSCNTNPTATPTPAASKNDDGVDLTKPAGCVTIALPILSGGATCVQNDQGTGGAIVNYLRDILKLVGTAVGLVIVLMLIIAGIQYITSAGDSGRVKGAKDRIVGAITALILFMFMVAILQFLVPGGIL